MELWLLLHLLFIRHWNRCSQHWEVLLNELTVVKVGQISASRNIRTTREDCEGKILTDEKVQEVLTIISDVIFDVLRNFWTGVEVVQTLNRRDSSVS